MAYSGRWNATDQIPERAISDGSLGRVGSLNPRDGGESTRTSLSFVRVLRDEHAATVFSAYVISYGLGPFSTFSFNVLTEQKSGKVIPVLRNDRAVGRVRASL